MNLVVVEQAEISDAGDVALTDARATHLLAVLKVTAGRAVRIGLLDGPFGTGAVLSVTDKSVTLRCQFEADAPPRAAIDLLLALPRPKVMRRLWAQLSALGVGRIMLTNAERVERHYFDTHLLAEDAYRPLLIEGLQQARDTRLPLVSIHRQFKILVEDQLDAFFPQGIRVMADPAATSTIDGAVAKGAAGSRLLLAIGPEGGWNDFERALLVKHGFHAVTMGHRTLRSDTACIALVTLAHRAMSMNVREAPTNSSVGTTD